MGDIPTTQNGEAQTVTSIIHAAVYDVAVQAAEGAIIAAVPAFANPILSAILKTIMGFFADTLYTFLAKAGAIGTIQLQTDQELSAYEAAEAELRAAHLSGDPNALAKAIADFKTTLGELIHWDGSATV